MIGDYKIILMDYDGNTMTKYSSHIIPAVNDTILIDDDWNKSFIVRARHFSTNHLKVVLLGEIEESKNENI